MRHLSVSVGQLGRGLYRGSRARSTRPLWTKKRRQRIYHPQPEEGLPMTALPFLKMHGLGNDFVVIDLRDRSVALTLPQRRWIADQRRGIGCDQLILLEPPRQRVADVFMRIH